MTANKPMTGEQLDELMTVAVNMQRESEKSDDRPSAMFAYAVQVAVLELRKVRNDAAALAAENAGLKQDTPDLQTMMSALDAFFDDEEVPERAMLAAYNILRGAVETPATDAFLAEVRAQGVEMAVDVVKQCYDNICAGGLQENREYEESIVQPHLDGIDDELKEIIDQLRKGVQS